MARLLLSLMLSTAAVSAQSTWTGAVDSDWSNPANWSGPVPDGTIDATIPAGTASAPFLNAGATQDVRSLTVSLGAALTVESGAVMSIWGSLNVTGSLPGGGKLEFVGPQAATWSGLGSVPAVVVSKSGSLDVLAFTTIRGSLTLLSGAFRVGTGAFTTLVVQGSGTFSGGSLVVSTNAVLDVNGDAIFSGTSAAGAMASLKCSGNFTGHAAFAPTSGEVVLDGTAQALSGPCRFRVLRIAAGSTTVGALEAVDLGATIEAGASLQLTSIPPFSGDFSVLGTLDTSAGVFDTDGAVDVRGVWIRGSHPSWIGRSLLGNGTLSGSGQITFDGSQNSSLDPLQNLPSVRIARAPSSVFRVGAATIQGTLELVSGQLDFAAASFQATTVQGTALFTGGSLGTGGTLDVNGDVVFAGTQCTSFSPNILCSGTWTGHPAYAPIGGTVTFDGGVQTLIGACSFPVLSIASGSSLTTGGATVCRRLDVQAGGQLTTTASLTSTGQAGIAGVLLSGGGPVSIALNVTITGTWDTGGIAPRLGSDLNGSGTFLPGGLVVFDGAIAGTINFPSPLPSVRIEKEPGASLTGLAMTVQGDFTLVTGRFVLNSVTVQGSAFFQGGSIETNGLFGSIDVLGNMVQSGTLCTGPSATVRCGGNWTGHPTYTPTSGLTVLYGASSSVQGTSVFFDLSIPAGANVAAAAPIAVRGGLSIGGSLSTSGADVDRHVLIDAVGSWNVGAFASTVGGGLTGPGPVLGSGTITMDGSLASQIGAITRLPSIRIAKATNVVVTLNGNAVVDGDLELASGLLRIGNFAGFVLTVNGNGRFLGGLLGTLAVCTIDLNGNATFGGTTVSGTLPTIRCSGNWTGHPSFLPTSGSVVFDGVDQTITGSANFPAVTIAAGTTVHASSGAVFRQLLTVDGTLQSNGMAAQGDVLVNQGGTWTVDPGTTTLSLGLSGLGTVQGPGTLTFIGSSPATLGAFTGLPSLQVAKTSPANLDLTGVSSVNGSFELTTGSVRAGIAAGQRLDVAGDASFRGGVLSATVPGLFVVAGDVRFTGTLCLATPSFHCGGDWSSDAGYSPTSGGSLAFDGAQPSTIELTSPARVLRAPGGISITGGVRTAISDVDFETPSLTIAAGSGLSASGRVLNLHATGTATNVAVSGQLELLAGSRLRLGPATSCSIAAGGSLSLLGTPLQRVVVEGDPTAGGGYSLVVDGFVAARNFSVLQPGPDGLVLQASATVASAPDDLRGARFDLPANVPGAALLTIARAQSTQLRYADFANGNAAVGVFNVRCTTGGGLDLVNWSGAFAGSAFEDDPSGLVQWLPPVQTSVLSFVAQAGSEKVALEWVLGSLEDAAAFVVERSDGGPFVAVVERAEDGSAAYQFVDRPLVAGTTYTYRLSQRLTHGELVVLATAVATPFSALSPANVLDVGPTGVHASPAAALAAAVLAGQADVILRLQPGVHPSFVVDAPSIQSLSIVGDGAGVEIDTTLGPVVVRNVAASGFVVLSDLVVGSASSPGPGLRIENCAGLVVVDETEVHSAATASTAMAIVGSTRTALQRAVVEPMLFVDAGSFTVVGATSLGALDVTGASYVQTCEVVVGSVQVGVGSTHEALAGTMPQVAADDLAALGMPLSIDFRSDAGQVFAIAVEALPGFAVAPASAIELPVLLAFVSPQVLAVAVTDANGDGGLSPLLPNLPAYLGLHVFVQGAQLGAGTIRLSNLEAITIVP